MDKKTKLILSSLFLLPILAFCQISGEIEFGTEYLGMSIDTSKIDKPEFLEHVLMHDNNSKIALASDESYYTLEFNDKGAITKFIPIMEVDNQRISPRDYALIGEYFVKEDTVYEKRSYGKENYYVKMNFSYKWELVDEYKNILGYKCQKAKTLFKTDKRDIPITAWFTLDIPASYGPYRYYGLPGIILEVRELGRLHYARKINLNKNNNLDFPDEKHLITKEEFYKLY